MPLANGTIFDDRYQIESLLGSGGIGTVYKAIELGLNRTVAIKTLSGWSSASNQTDNVRRLQREAQALCDLHHNNILQVYRFGFASDGLPFLVMEYIEGESLRQVLDRGLIDYKLGIRICIELAEALQYSHANGIIHRDVKPENIIIRQNSGNSLELKLIDFGLCRPETDSKPGVQALTRTGDWQPLLHESGAGFGTTCR